MSDEAEIGSAGTTQSRGHSQGGDGFSSPLQTRAQFLKNWNWQSVISINRGACERGRAQHGINSEAASSCAETWKTLQLQTLTLGTALDELRTFHKRAPFLFFNGNTFATIGRELALALFSDLAPMRKREVSSAVAHFIAGVLDREAMVEIVETFSAPTPVLKAGDQVQTLRGTTRGTIVRLVEDGRVLWKPDGSESELMALPESLVRVRARRQRG